MSAVPHPVALSEVLARGDIWRGDALAPLPAMSIASGFPELDAELPGDGWPCGTLTEFLVDHTGIGELSLLLPALRQLSQAGGWLALVAPPALPHAPAWAAAGIVLERVRVIQPAQKLGWCCEQLMAAGSFAAVLAWTGQLDAAALRRLQVAVDGQSTLACLWRPRRLALTPSPAPLRLTLSGAGENLEVAIIKRRGRPATRALHLFMPRPGRRIRALAGAAFSPVADRVLAVSNIAQCSA